MCIDDRTHILNIVRKRLDGLRFELPPDLESPIFNFKKKELVEIIRSIIIKSHIGIKYYERIIEERKLTKNPSFMAFFDQLEIINNFNKYNLSDIIDEEEDTVIEIVDNIFEFKSNVFSPSINIFVVYPYLLNLECIFYQAFFETLRYFNIKDNICLFNVEELNIEVTKIKGLKKKRYFVDEMISLTNKVWDTFKVKFNYLKNEFETTKISLFIQYYFTAGLFREITIHPNIYLFYQKNNKDLLPISLDFSQHLTLMKNEIEALERFNRQRPQKDKQNTSLRIKPSKKFTVEMQKKVYWFLYNQGAIDCSKDAFLKVLGHKIRNINWMKNDIEFAALIKALQINELLIFPIQKKTNSPLVAKALESGSQFKDYSGNNFENLSQKLYEADNNKEKYHIFDFIKSL